MCWSDSDSDKYWSVTRFSSKIDQGAKLTSCQYPQPFSSASCFDRKWKYPDLENCTNKLWQQSQHTFVQ